MGDTVSEATSPYSASERANSSMYTHSNHTYQQYFGRQMDEAMAHSQPSRHQILQGEPSVVSDLSRKRCCRVKMNEAEKREHKRQIDKRHRQKKKNEAKTMMVENENLKCENDWLRDENSRLNEENVCLSAGKRQLQDECERLTIENKHLRWHSSGLLGKGQLAEQVLHRQDSHISQSTSQVDHPNVYEQDHHGMEYNNEATYTFDGLEMNDLLMSEAFPEHGFIPNGRVSLAESAPEEIESSQGGLHNCQMALTAFLEKLEAEVESNVNLSDFSGLGTERRKYGRYSFPLSLIPIAKRINEVHGDVSFKVLINRSLAEAAYVVFCAAIKEMCDLQLEEVTEDKMLKWRDAINDVLCLNFNVRFAMEHLKKIASAYFGAPASQHLQDMKANVSKLESKLNNEKRKLVKIYEDTKSLIADTQEFNGVPVGTGLFPPDPT